MLRKIKIMNKNDELTGYGSFCLFLGVITGIIIIYIIGFIFVALCQCICDLICHD